MSTEKLNYQFEPERLTPNQEFLALSLINIDAIKLGEFKLKLHEKYPKAPFSPIYINLRLLRRYPQIKKVAVDTYTNLLKQLDYYYFLSDIPTSATPFVSSLSDRLGVPMVTPRTDKKTHGTVDAIDGFDKTDIGQRVVVVDDVCTRADSKFAAIAILESAGYVVNDVVVLIDREQGGREELEKRGYSLHSAMTLSRIIVFYRRQGLISKHQFSRITEQIQSLDEFLKRTNE